MKRIVSGEFLQEKMLEAVNLLCDTVKTTIGPRGSNIIIDHSTFNPFITNDGVTIAENIESEDPVINTILELAKESSIKTNEIVGDGTTTTLVLLQSIFNNGIKLVKEGVSPIILKNELNNALKEIIAFINKESKIPSQEDIKSIATISSNDTLVGKIVSETYLKILNKDAISIKEWDKDYIKVNYLKGYSMDSNLASLYFLNGLKEKEINNPFVLIINDELNDIEDIANVLNEIIKNNGKLIVIANDYNEIVIQNILTINMESEVDIILLKAPQYGMKRQEILEDLACICNAKLINNIKNNSLDNLGKVNKIIISNEKVVFNFKFNERIKLRMLKLNENYNRVDSESDFIKKRLTMFENGCAEILVGAQTITERRELKMRFDDALWAVSVASNGVVLGSGLVFCKISCKLNEYDNGYKIMKDALLRPFEQIFKNAGLDYKSILKKISDNNYKIIYNISTNEYEKMDNTKVLDPKDVVINSVSNATSIAGMLLSTTSLVINEYKNNLNKINDYNEY